MQFFLFTINNCDTNYKNQKKVCENIESLQCHFSAKPQQINFLFSSHIQDVLHIYCSHINENVIQYVMREKILITNIFLLSVVCKNSLINFFFEF